jgi:hypothetical protein
VTLPKPDTRVTPSQDEFSAWAEHPVSRFVAAAFARAAEQQREAWVDQSWATGQADPNELAILRARADAYMAFLETGLERYVELNESR